MNWHALGRRAALTKFALAVNHPLMRGGKVDVGKPKETDAESPSTPPKARVWPPPPHATSGTLLNPKVA